MQIFFSLSLPELVLLGLSPVPGCHWVLVLNYSIIEAYVRPQSRSMQGENETEDGTRLPRPSLLILTLKKSRL